MITIYLKSPYFDIMRTPHPLIIEKYTKSRFLTLLTHLVSYQTMKYRVFGEITAP